MSGLLQETRGTVRLLQTREETFLAHRGRPWTLVKMKIGLKRDGRITALALQATQAGGAYAGYGIITILYTGALMHGIYDIPAIKHDAWRVYTNLPPCGAQRGHGTVDTRAAFEALLKRKVQAFHQNASSGLKRPIVDALKDEAFHGAVNRGDVTAIADAKSGKATLQFEKKGDSLVSKTKLPEGDGYNVVVQFKQTADAKPVNLRFKLDLATCGECKRAEYACTCDE